MKMTDFARERGVNRDTITQYIRRNDELFKGHTEVKGKSLYIDEVALDILDKKYPLHKPVELIEDIETIKELSETRMKLVEASKMIINLQNKITEQSLLIAKAEAIQMLLEDKTKELERIENMLEKAETRVEKAETRAEMAEEQKTAADDEIAALRKELEVERNKSWWDKLRGR